MFKSAVFRLTLWYVAMFVGLSVIFSGTLFWLARRELNESLTEQYRALDQNDHDGDNLTATRTVLDQRTGHLAIEIIYFNCVLLVAASAASYLLARRTLSPLEKSHQAQVNFTAEASHELRTPLAAIKADTEATLIDKNATKIQMANTLRRNIEDVDRLEALSTSLLELAHITSRHSVPHKPVQLQEVVDTAVKQFSGRAKQVNVKIISEALPAKVLGSHGQLERSVAILIDNAIKYSEPGNTIRVTSGKRAGKAFVEVADEGVGINRQDLPHVFERFYRARTTGNNALGYGLGLPIAKEIVGRHGGSIKLVSTPGSGTTATITLPLPG